MLGKLLQLRGVTFEYRDPETINELHGAQVGMIAQEVEQVFPQWVDEGPDGYKRLTFRGFEALVIEGIRELRAESDTQIAEMRDILTQQQSLINELKIEIEGLRGKMRVAEATGKIE